MKIFAECNQATLDLHEQQFLFLTRCLYFNQMETDQKKLKQMIDSMKRGTIVSIMLIPKAENIVDISLMPIVVKGKTMLHTSWRNITVP